MATDEQFGGGTGTGDTGFWVRLTKKTYTLDGYRKYDWTQVVDSDNPTPLDWAFGGKSGTADDHPIYEVNDIDLAVNDMTGGGGGGSGSSGSGGTGKPVIYWARPGQGDYYLIDMVPRWEMTEKTSDPDADGLATGNLLRYDQDIKLWIPDGSCLLIDANAP